jgi:hypothetical protein
MNYFRTTLILLASLGSSHAFSTSSSFTRRMPAPPTCLSSSPSCRSTALSMNLFDRFQRVAKANLNNVLQSLEDPEKIMTQALEDMQVSVHDQDHQWSCRWMTSSHTTPSLSAPDRFGQSPSIIRRNYSHTAPSPEAKRAIRRTR